MRLFDRVKDFASAVVRAIVARWPKTRGGKILLYAAAGVCAAGFVGSLTIAVWSGYPSFCKSCHHIRPFHASWASSVHGKEGVACTDCHFEPGLIPYAMGKVNGLVEVVKYFSGGYPVKLRSEVADVSCLREGCHSQDELEAEPVELGLEGQTRRAGPFLAVAGETRRQISFDHEKHSLAGRSHGVAGRPDEAGSTALTGRAPVEGAPGLGAKAGRGADEPPASAGKLRGLHFRCATCHSTSMHSEDKTVSHNVCFTCHFMPGPEESAEETAEEREAREKLGKCDACHDVPKEVTTLAGTTLDHEKYPRRPQERPGSTGGPALRGSTGGPPGAASDSECFRCHAYVTRGDGVVLKERCLTCHNEGLDHLEKFEEGEVLHAEHVLEHQVACFECHDEIRHGVTGVVALATWPRSFSPTGLHSAAEKLYRGTGGAGVEDVPDPMFVTDVQCAGCHASLREKGGEGGTEPNARNQERPARHGPALRGSTGGLAHQASESCVICHEEGYDKLPARWKAVFDGYVSKLWAAHERAASLDQPGPRQKLLLAEAARNIELVRAGGAAHNVRYAALCLRHASAGLGEVLSAAGLSDVAVALPTYEADAAKCLEVCHLGVETVGDLKYAEYTEEDFPHREHVESRRVKCSQCHSFDDEEHKETFKKTGDCNACHHEEETVAGKNACKSCHPAQDAVYFGKVAGVGSARPAKMAVATVVKTDEEVTCISCHKGLAQGHSKEKLVQLCQECHGGQEARARILDEWQAGIRAELEGLEALIRRGKAHLADGRGLSEGAAEALRRACATSEEVAEVVRQDKSFGAHNLEYLYGLLSGASRELRDPLSVAER